MERGSSAFCPRRDCVLLRVHGSTAPKRGPVPTRRGGGGGEGDPPTPPTSYHQAAAAVSGVKCTRLAPAVYCARMAMGSGWKWVTDAGGRWLADQNWRMVESGGVGRGRRLGHVGLQRLASAIALAVSIDINVVEALNASRNEVAVRCREMIHRSLWCNR